MTLVDITPDISMGMLELGTIYLGGVALTDLHRVDRVPSTPPAPSPRLRPPSAGTACRTARTCSDCSESDLRRGRPRWMWDGKVFQELTEFARHRGAGAARIGADCDHRYIHGFGPGCARRAA